MLPQNSLKFYIWVPFLEFFLTGPCPATECRPELILTKILLDADQLFFLFQIQTGISEMQTKIALDADHADQLFLYEC